MSDDDTPVWVTKRNGGAPNVYHTDEDCHRIEDPENADDWTKGTLPWDVPECQFCDGGIERSNGDRSYITALKEEARDNAGGSA